ncbi:MAG: hypothetical protein PHR69_08125 [Sphaerochaeta sp.]|nr:hypothetical protein [Sphaerochaeta sp.]
MKHCKKTECYDVTFQNYNALQKRVTPYLSSPYLTNENPKQLKEMNRYSSIFSFGL